MKTYGKGIKGNMTKGAVPPIRRPKGTNLAQGFRKMATVPVTESPKGLRPRISSVPLPGPANPEPPTHF